MAGPTIGLNLLYLAPGHTGGSEVYARALLPELPRAWPDARWVVFASREVAGEWGERPWAEGMRLVGLPVSGATRVRRVAAEQTLLPAAAKRHRVDLLHSLATTQPALVPGVRTVTTIHDLIYKRFPETHAGLLAHGMAMLVPLAARSADRVITISRSARDDLVRFLRVPEAKIDVVPQGPGIAPGAQATPEPDLRARLELGDGPFVLSVSAIRPHKNLDRLVRALASADGATLVVPGYHDAEHIEQLRATARECGIAERVRFPGWLGDEDIEGLYAACTCLAFPSLAEGFGLPVLEAMRRGVPVACSNATSLPEVAGDAALMFDPESVDDIAAALRALLGDEALRARLAALGREQAQRFSWEATARGTVAAYRRAL